MILRLDSTRLHDRLQQRSEWIGFGPKATHIIAVVEGLFLILTALTTTMGYWWRIGFTVIAVGVTVYSIASAIMTCRNGYDAQKLYEELIGMDRTERHSSIIAINDGNRYLLYHDTQWDCDFFPNHATASTDGENERLLSNYLSTGFDIPESDFTLTRITSESHEKYSPEHDETRYYDYTLYKATINRMPEAWKHDRFHVDSKDCMWKTTAQMLDDPVIREHNSDVVGMVRTHL